MTNAANGNNPSKQIKFMDEVTGKNTKISSEIDRQVSRAMKSHASSFGLNDNLKPVAKSRSQLKNDMDPKSGRSYKQLQILKGLKKEVDEGMFSAGSGKV